MEEDMERLVKQKEVLRRCGISAATLYRLIKKGKFPESVNISERAVAWANSEIEQWIEERMRERYDK
jgi:prophage regulatory protein|tara:strand:- start:146 stop:346 length:201 start_codon:yes stop_codon:yes gene_type:complete